MIAIFHAEPGEGPTAILYDITFVSEIQLRREIDDCEIIQQGIEHGWFGTDGRAKSAFRNQLPSIPGTDSSIPTFYFSAVAQKMVKYARLSRCISGISDIEAALVVPLLFGNMGGCHPATMEALAHHPLGKSSRNNIVAGSPRIPHVIPDTAKGIIELTFDAAITALKTWHRFKTPLGYGIGIDNGSARDEMIEVME
jgi:hypothetical protein